ncbi:MAG: hypothetical protein HWE15_10790 [Algoriphagus sp.]|uniref:hypothetical protein n=1 Tax=Algoriphagus sp. TaxID=1872435 RepID=UPI00185CBC6E|nr:hypothetical protein [Algoriphagus sp.]NVJ86782.1 hypothetical protein [Algoriphagus sp.]
MKKFLIQLSKYFLIIALIANLLALMSNFLLKRSSIFKASFLVNNFEPEQAFDYFIIGSSRGLTSIGSEEIDQKLTTKGINLSQDDTGLPSQLLMAKHFFESGFQSSYCILVLDEPDFEHSSMQINDNDYRMAPYLQREYIYDYFRKRERGIIRPYTLGKYVPAVLYAYYNTELFIPSLFTLFRPNYRHRFDKYGNYTYPDNQLNTQNELLKPIQIQKNISNPLLHTFEEYLRAKGCQLILYVAPYQGRELIIQNEFDIPLINHSSILLENSDFYDPIHLNNKGKIVASSFLAEELQPFFLK